ncbi:MAG: heme-binding protein [Clostridia bacterium]|nr:heme-binding protein [Clostridia bacterium]
MEREQMLKENYAVYLLQDQTYRFPSFGREDVWELGCDLVESCKTFDGPLAVEIYIGDVMMFRYFPPETGTLHEMWLGRKRSTVRALGKSSMLVAAELAVNGQTITDVVPGLPKKDDYADCGGGFPLRMQDGCVFGFAGVSGMADTLDHAALIGGLDRFFRRRGWIE